MMPPDSTGILRFVLRSSRKQCKACVDNEDSSNMDSLGWTRQNVGKDSKKHNSINNGDSVEPAVI